jgi:hypothetical protein
MAERPRPQPHDAPVQVRFRGSDVSPSRVAIAGGIGALAAAALVAGPVRWQAGTRRLRSRLEAGRVPVYPSRVQFSELEGLPEPVARYFRVVLRDGQPMIAGLRVRHRGTFNMGRGTDWWRPFSSEQRVIVRRPGFDWNARVRMLPGLPVFVHDAYVGGEGILQASVLGLLPVVYMRGSGAIAEGELMRFFAEAAWYPTALLPSQGVRWEAVDGHSARATLSDGPIVLSLLFTFDADGHLAGVRADARGYAEGSRIIPMPWEGRFWDHAQRDGMVVPLQGEVAWLLPGGRKPYWRGRLTAIAYEYATESSVAA